MFNINSGISGVFNFLKSLKLTVMLVTVIVLLLIISGVLPQGLPISNYTESYGFIGYLFFILGFTNVRESFVFIFLIYLFLVNLTFCSVYKVYKQINTKKWSFFGSDIIHLGIILLIISSLINFHIGYTKSGISSDFYNLSIPDKIRNHLDDNDNDNSNKTSIRSGFYNLSFLSETTILFATLKNDNLENDIVIDSLSPIVINDIGFDLIDITSDSALFYNHDSNSTISLLFGDSLGPYKLVKTSSSIFKGIKISYNPGFYIFILGLAIFFIGLIVTLIYKLKDDFK